MQNKFVRILLIAMVLALVIPTFVGSTPVQADVPLPEEQVLNVRYNTQAELERLGKAYDVVEVHPETMTVKIFSNEITRQALASEGFTWVVDMPYTRTINTIVEPLPGQTQGIPGFTCFRTIAEGFAAANQLATQYPDLVRKVDIGDSWEKVQNPNKGWDMQVLVLGSAAPAGVVKFNTFIMSGIHAREWAAPELNIRFAEYLLSNYASNPDVKWLLDYSDIHLLFFSNPDGRLQDEANTTWLWRKNTNNNFCSNQNSNQGYGRGIDLNRNYPFAWEYSSSQCDPTFAGPSAGSESETQAIVNYVRTIFPDQREPDPTRSVDPNTGTGMFIDLHSYSRLVLWPWGYTYDLAPNDAQLKTMSYKFAYYNGHTPQKSTALYPSAGTTDDWAYGELGVPGFCFELGDTFHESCTKFDGDIHPKNVQALIRAVKIARLPYTLTYGPEVTNLSGPSEPVQVGQNMTFTMTLDDTLYSTYSGGIPSQYISALRYSIDKPSWVSGANPIIVNKPSSSPKLTTSITISTNGLTPGVHTLFVEGKDVKFGPPTAINFTVVAQLPTSTPSPTPTPAPTPTPTPIIYKIFMPMIEN